MSFLEKLRKLALHSRQQQSFLNRTRTTAQWAEEEEKYPRSNSTLLRNSTVLSRSLDFNTVESRRHNLRGSRSNYLNRLEMVKLFDTRLELKTLVDRNDLSQRMGGLYTRRLHGRSSRGRGRVRGGREMGTLQDAWLLSLTHLTKK